MGHGRQGDFSGVHPTQPPVPDAGHVAVGRGLVACSGIRAVAPGRPAAAARELADDPDADPQVTSLAIQFRENEEEDE